MRRNAVQAALAVAFSLAPAACGADDSTSEPGPSSTTAASPAATESPTESSPSPEPTPSLPIDDTPLDAADGDDIDACYDGECEVEVAASTVVPFDPETGIEAYTIDELGEDYMVVGTHLGPVQSGIGTCSAINDVAFILRSVTDGRAVVAFFPADSCED